MLESKVKEHSTRKKEGARTYAVKTKKLYLCKIGEVKEIRNSLFVGVKKVSYFHHDRLRLAKVKVNKLTGRKKYELVISGEELDVGYERVKCAGDLFVAEASNLLMMLEAPTAIKKNMPRKKLLRLEWVLNELGKDEAVDRLGAELLDDDNTDIDKLKGYGWDDGRRGDLNF